MIDESRENIMKEKFVELRAKTYSYLIDHSSGDKKGQSAKCVSKKENFSLKILKIVQKELKLENKINQQEKKLS